MYKLFITIVAIAALAQPVLASAACHNCTREDDVPVVTDAATLRPLGIAATCIGFVFWVATAPIQAITRPTDMGKTFTSLVILPARFTWADPLGYHPDRVEAEKAGEIK